MSDTLGYVPTEWECSWLLSGDALDGPQNTSDSDEGSPHPLPLIDDGSSTELLLQTNGESDTVPTIVCNDEVVTNSLIQLCDPNPQSAAAFGIIEDLTVRPTKQYE
jgi:hypothetical protein